MVLVGLARLRVFEYVSVGVGTVKFSRPRVGYTKWKESLNRRGVYDALEVSQVDKA